MASRLSQILEQEYKNMGVVSGSMSAVGKRAREKLDVRNALFSGSGVGSILGRKILGKGYSATAKGVGSTRSASPTIEGLSNSTLENINTNTSITAKNTSVMPMMARDMNLMKLNMFKVVKLLGGTANTNKTDMFWSNAKKREENYQSQFGKSSTSPTSSNNTNMAKPSEEGGGLLSMLFKGLLAGGLLAGIGKLLENDQVRETLKGFATSVIAALFNGIGKTFELLADILTSDEVIKAFKDMVVGIFSTLGKVLEKKVDLGSLGEWSLGGILAATVGAFAAFKGALLLAQGALLGIGARMAGGAIGGAVAGAGATAAGAAGIGVMGVLGVGAAIGAVIGSLYLLKKSMDERVDDRDVPLTPQEELDSVTSAGADTSYKPPMVVAAEKRRAAEKQKRIDAKIKEYEDSNAYLQSQIDNPNERTNVTSLQNQIKKNKELIDKLKGGSSPSPTPAGSDSQSAASSTTPTGSSLLDLIASGESGKAGYDAANKGNAGDMPEGYPGLSKLTVNEVMGLQSAGKVFAAGRYQIIPKTLAGLMSGAYGNTGVKGDDLYNASTQDKLATALINKRLKEGGGDPIKTQLALSQEFASIADPSTGKSYYAGKGNNKASISTAQIQAVLSGTPGASPSAVAQTPTIPGNQIASASNPNSGLLDQLVEDTRVMKEIELNKQMQQAAASPVFRGGQMPGAPQMKATPYPEEFYRGLVGANSLHSS
jgi:hypothetical protein